MTHTNPDHEKAGKDLIRLQQMRIEDTRGPGLCIRTGQAELISHVQDAHFIEYSRNPETLEALRRQAAKSLMTVPIRCGERVIGALTLVSTESKRTFSAEDLHLAIELAERTGLALRNSREAGLPEARSL